MKLWDKSWRWGLGDYVAKKSGGAWRGVVCGFYATEVTARGYVVESLFEPGSAQLWPEAALEPWAPFRPVDNVIG